MHKYMRAGLAAFAAGFLIGLGSCSNLPFDRSVSAAEGNDATVFFSGCGSPAPTRAHIFVQVRDTAQATCELTLHLPDLKCDRPSCLLVQLVNKDGSFGESFGIPKGQRTLKMPISAVVGSEVVGPAADGEYQALVKGYFTGNDGEENQRNMRGFVRVNVLTADYVPMACDDPAAAWSTPLVPKPKVCHAQWTTQFRGALCGDCGGS